MSLSGNILPLFVKITSLPAVQILVDRTEGGRKAVHEVEVHTNCLVVQLVQTCELGLD